ncbi:MULTISPECIES: hypothetical protein [unclassified Clostridium]|jgi:hypothetical protein|uniref:plasmid mobilization protein n=1 Tax=unclassified Clostridium TaxID=2614128 RepID=UPI001C8B88E8|nr:MULTISPECIES: hypothetical protein [unclassified Clostridium]MBX9136682.1 hypothetical protein [Clostridium sp. K12(2020)]MBX9145295.1 hypothetical protein [Clostridium sp. K13]
MARDKSIKVRLTDNEDRFLTEQTEKLAISRSEYVRRLLNKEIDKLEANKNRLHS